MRALDAPLVSLPLEFCAGIAPIPGMGPGRDNGCIGTETPNQNIPEKRITILPGVVFHPHMNGQPFGQQNLSRHAVHIPRVPPLCQPLLHLLVLRGARPRTIALPRHVGRHRQMIRLRILRLGKANRSNSQANQQNRIPRIAKHRPPLSVHSSLLPQPYSLASISLLYTHPPSIT